nr:hypothetical protein [Micromonospora sp. DSM 115978]
LPPPDAYRLAVGLATALAGLHSVPVTFGGLKPSNVVMSERGLRLLAFGTTRAAFVASSLRRRTNAGVLGTPAFIAPEQVLGQPAGPATDVFAWGAVVLFAATGRLPFGEGPTRLAVQRAVYTEPDLRGLDRPLRTLVRVAMRKDPGARITAAELVLALVGVVGQGADVRPRMFPVTTIPRQARPDSGADATVARFPSALERLTPPDA